MLDISVIVVCLNEAACIGQTLETLTNQHYPKDNYEVLVVDGGSTDGTQEIVRDYEQSNDNVRLVVEPKKGVAAGRNTGVREASMRYVAFIDGDCTAPADWLCILAAGFEHWKACDARLVAVGGTNVAPDEADAFVRAIAVALDSFPGSFNSAQGKQFCDACHVPSLATLNVLYDKAAIDAVGGFDETLQSEAEDADLNFRLRRQGGCMVFLPESRVMHWMRATPRLWWQNMVRYGRGRARLLKRHPAMRSWIYALPLLFLLGMALSLLSPFWLGFSVPLLYFPAILAYAVYLSARKGALGLALHVALVFMVQHFGYAVGEAQGLLDKRVA